MSTMPAQNRTDQTHRGMKDIKSDAAALKRDLAHLRDDVVDVGSQAAQDATERLRHGADSIGHQFKSAHESACKRISDHPTAAVLVALGVGAVIGRMLWR